MNISNTLFNTISNKLKLDVSLLSEEKIYLNNLNDAIFSLKGEIDADYKKNWKLKQIYTDDSHISEHDFVIMYIITVSFLKANTIIHVSDIKGNVKMFYSSGSVQLTGKQKTKRRPVILRLVSLLAKKAVFLKKKPIALHLNNVGSSNKVFVVNNIKNFFYIKLIKSFNQTPYNGCRKRKIRRKKNIRKTFK